MKLHIYVNNKIAVCRKRDGDIVCGNSDYKIQFSFDSEWDSYSTKTARFIWNGTYLDVFLVDDTCNVPTIINSTECKVGVYVGDPSSPDLQTTTPAVISCKKSILCETATPREDSDREYASEAREYAQQAAESAQQASESEAAIQEVKTMLDNGEFNGEDGLTPFIGTNGNWWIGDEDTGTSATGGGGGGGTQGERGYGWYSTTNYIAESGIDSVGLSYINVPEGDALKVGDFIISQNNHCYAKVTAIQDTTVTYISHGDFDGMDGSRIFTTTQPLSTTGGSIMIAELWIGEKYFQYTSDVNIGDIIMSSDGGVAVITGTTTGTDYVAYATYNYLYSTIPENGGGGGGGEGGSLTYTTAQALRYDTGTIAKSYLLLGGVAVSGTLTTNDFIMSSLTGNIAQVTADDGTNVSYTHFAQVRGCGIYLYASEITSATTAIFQSNIQTPTGVRLIAGDIIMSTAGNRGMAKVSAMATSKQVTVEYIGDMIPTA